MSERPAFVEVVEQADLDHPVLVLGLSGFIDAGGAAGDAIEAVLAGCTTKVVARFDVDELIDLRARRPVLKLRDGVNEGLEWPELVIRGGHDPRGRDVLLLTGPEPDYRWRPFARAVVDLAVGWECRLVCGLGAYPGPSPHTRPVRVVSTATTTALAEQVGHLDGPLDVPASASGAIETECQAVGLPAVGLWAQVPHYAATMAYPAAAVALLDALQRIGGVCVDRTSVDERVAPNLARITELVDQSTEASRLVEQLEQHVDRMAEMSDPSTAEDLVAEIQRYLREEGGGG